MQSLPTTPHGLIRFDDVRTIGREAELARALAAGEVTRIRRGVYARVAGEAAAGSAGERDAQRYLTAVLAAGETMRHAVFTGFSALALAGIPIFGRWPADISVMSTDAQGHRRAGVISVAGSYAPTRATEGGHLVTSVEFSLIQLCRQATLAAALTATDAALRVPRFGPGRPRTTIAAIRAEHQRLLPYRGSRRTEAVLARATDSSDTTLETVGRLVIEELGFEEPELQHELWLPELAKRAFLDFYWPSVDAGGEADGRGKYLGSARASATAAAVVIAEKERENAVRRQVRAFDRWDWSETLRRTPLERRLVAMGVPRTRRRSTLVGSPEEPAAITPISRRRPVASRAERA
ncbi:type IV toxin-antitoxin system AbiEi family antitoxin domain-containing protein [Agromyces badenianii]|uniref:type IV toxin-antitoxin system AbiEi family antitoxin domain-containing protein n=1 Tax=Agromyces badenianii TaxID=2080742 RepID=UPI000D597371|nr:type IV toxin-antitoxin system AbiEi family antitoxin domain-containing protein [Agromyces badenianii]PWC03678.1 hypothetical protein DCE94_11800 [Agromyces badenianii]